MKVIRFQNLFNENSASQKELDDMTARYEMAKARLEAANQMKNEVNSQFAYANIRAPFSGVVTNTYIDKGDMANPGVPLVSVESPGGFEVEAKVAENNISAIKVGTNAHILVKALDTTITGKVSELSASAQNTGGQYVMKVVLDKTDAKILSGMYATVRLEAENESDGKTVVTVPSKALVHKGQLTGVYTLGQDNVALLRWLRLGENFGDEAFGRPVKKPADASDGVGAASTCHEVLAFKLRGAVHGCRHGRGIFVDWMIRGAPAEHHVRRNVNQWKSC